MASCDPKWHRGVHVPAAYMVAATNGLEASPGAPVTVELSSSTRYSMARFACCAKDLERAVDLMTDRTRYVVVWKVDG